MRLACLQEQLDRGLATVGRAVPGRTTLPITQNVLMEAEGSRIVLTATNLEMAITTWLEADVQEPGSLTVPARLLTEFVHSLPGGQIHLRGSADPLGLEVESGRSQAYVNGADPDDFPPIPEVTDGCAVRMSPQELRTATQQVVFAAATEESRPVLTGVKVEARGEELTMAAADGFRLAVHYGSLLEAVEEDVDLVVPARALNEAVRLLGDQGEPVEMVVDPAKSQVLFRLSGAQLVSKLLEGSFPNYMHLVPQGYACRGVVDVQQFQRATRTASIFARDGSGIVRVQLEPGEGEGEGGRLLVSARADEVGDHHGELDARVEGEGGKVAFNSKYLQDVLGALQKGEIALETTEPSSAGVFKPVGSNECLHVVMPMFVQW